MSSYSQYKIINFPSHIDQLKTKTPIVPLHLELNPVNFCNHDCKFCTYRAQETDLVNAHFNIKDMLATEDMIRIITEAASCGVRAIQYCGGGEPTLHPDIFDIIEYTIAMGLDCAMVTNGAKITEQVVSKMYDMSWIRFSINGADPSTYSKCHGLPDKLGATAHDQAWEAVSVCVNTLEKTEVSISFIVTPDNYKQIGQIIAKAKSYGVSSIRIGAEVYTDGRADTLLKFKDEINMQLEDSEGLTDDDFVIYSNMDSRISNRENTEYEYGDDCYHHWLVGIIGADGYLYSCCVKKYCADGRITNVLDKPLLEAFTGREHIIWGERINPCISCKRGCFLKPKNDVIKSIFSGQKHNTFI